MGTGAKGRSPGQGEFTIDSGRESEAAQVIVLAGWLVWFPARSLAAGTWLGCPAEFPEGTNRVCALRPAVKSHSEEIGSFGPSAPGRLAGSAACPGGFPIFIFSMPGRAFNVAPAAPKGGGSSRNRLGQKCRENCKRVLFAAVRRPFPALQFPGFRRGILPRCPTGEKLFLFTLVLPRMASMTDTLRAAVPGLLLSAIIALAVRFVSDHLGGPAMLYALLFGMAFNFLCEDERFLRGIRFASRHVLRFGVALLGLRITTADVMGLGWHAVALVVAAVVTTILLGILIGRAAGLRNDQSILSAGAVAICGASAALAIASILPSHKEHERNTILTVAGVTALSTLAMIVYPVFVSYIQYDDVTAGIFLGATIHDVAQVVGAGYIISDQAGEISTLVKLIRVACLVPVVVVLSLLMHRRRSPEAIKEPLLPWFLVAFVALVSVNSLGWVPAQAQAVLTPVSNWSLLTAVAALGVKTSLKALVEVGLAPVGVMVAQTALLAAFMIGGVALIR